MRNRKILLTGPSGSVHFERWLKMLSESGKFEIILVCIRDYWETEYKSYFLPFNRHLPYKINLLLSYLRFHSIVRKENPGIVHIHFLTPFALMSPGLKCPYIISLWGSDATYYYRKSYGIMRALYNMAYRNASYIFTAGKHLLTNLTACNANALNIVWGVDFGLKIDKIASRNYLNIPENAFVVMNLRVLRDIFQIERIIRCAEKAYPEIDNFVLLLIEGPDHDYNAVIRSMVSGKPYIRLLPFMEHTKFRKTLFSADIALSLAVRDGSPVSVKEAMAYNVPVIFQDIEGINETINDDTGIGLRTFNDDELSDTLIKLYNDPDMRKEISEKAHIHAAEYFDEKVIWKKTILTYEKLLKNEN